MWHVLLRIAVGVSLVVHGVAHLEIARVCGAREQATSWLLGETDPLGTALSTVALAGSVLAGVGAWRPLAVAAACVSLVTIALFWDRKMVLGLVVNAGIIVALLWARWPGRDLVGS